MYINNVFFWPCQVTNESLPLQFCHTECEVHNSSVIHYCAVIITSSYTHALKAAEYLQGSPVGIGHQLFLLSQTLPLKLEATLLFGKLQTWVPRMVTTGSVAGLSSWNFSVGWKCGTECDWRKNQTVKTGSCLGSVWCRELGYFWRRRGRARAVSFLVCYSFLYKLEFDSEPLVGVTPPVPLFHCPMIIADLLPLKFRPFSAIAGM